MNKLLPIPPENKICPICKNIFISFLKLNAKPYITCDECRLKFKFYRAKLKI